MSMTENRCIEVLKKMKHMFTETCAKIDENTALDMAVDAIEEIQEYRRIGLGNPTEVEQDLLLYKADRVLVNEYSEIGTVEDFKAIKQWKSDIIEDFCKYDVNSVDELMKRFRELNEKAEPKKPIYDEFDENELGEIIPYKATCPTCGFEFEFGTWNDEENHHCECGQRMGWE